ncbi:MOP flippase [Cytidiella melzeri]|nr:MOP flippase [Cytidiella melzeri]
MHSPADERRPLLAEITAQQPSPRSTDGTTTVAENETNRQMPSSITSSVGPLLVSLLVDSIPVILTYVLQNSIQTVSILVVGRLGPDELSAAAFSLMFAMRRPHKYALNPTGWCVALGGTTALDTLGSQAFTGGDRSTDVSVHLQRCIFLLWILFIPVALLWTFVEPVLRMCGQDERLSYDVQRFLRILIAGAPAYIAFESLKKYLQCQAGIMGAATIVLILVAPLNLAVNIIFVYHTPLGFLGAPVAISLTYWTAFFTLVLLTYLSPSHSRNETWGGFQPRVVLDLRSCLTFLQLALPGILMVGTEWAAFEIVALAAGRLGALPLAAQSIIMTADQILNTIPFGIGVAASTRVGNLIGLRSATAAKRASHASALLSVVTGLVIMITLLATKNVFGKIFSDDMDVVELVSKVMPLVASFQIADGLAGSCGGVLRGQGRQHLGALFNLVAYYVLALPMGITLAFHPRTHLGLQGLWIGQVVALFVVGLGEYTVVWLGTNWEREVERGIERNREEAKRRLAHDGASVGLQH